jgi:hypothetical protein
MDKADLDFEPTATHVNAHSMLHNYIDHCPMDKEDLDYEATAKYANVHSMQHNYKHRYPMDNYKLIVTF